MAYSLKEVTIRTDNSEEGMEHIGELWRHIMDGRLPILFDRASVPGRNIPCFQVQQL